MNGLVIRDTPIAVDFWNIRECHGARIFFLSHFHADHMCHLSSSWRYPIYCDPVTAKLLIAFKQIKEDIVKPLEVGSSHIIPLDDVDSETMTVTTIDANHCPGAVMFVFQGYFGNILYTGDFRYEDPSMLSHPVFQSGRLRIDRLYLDNTYCSPTCSNFPSKRVAIQQIVDLVRRNHDTQVFIAVRKLGKEALLVELARLLHCRIVVSPNDLLKMELLGLPEVFTTDQDASRIRAVPFHEVTPSRCWRYLPANHGGQPSRSLFILPTCLFWSGGGVLSQGPPKKWPPGVEVKVVNYSDHSSFNELSSFVARVRPCRIEPIVCCGRATLDPAGRPPANNDPTEVFEELLSDESPVTFEVPRSVQLNMGTLKGRPVRSWTPYPGTANKHNNNVTKIATAVKGVIFSDSSDDSQGEEINRDDDVELLANEPSTSNIVCQGPKGSSTSSKEIKKAEEEFTCGSTGDRLSSEISLQKHTPSSLLAITSHKRTQSRHTASHGFKEIRDSFADSRHIKVASVTIPRSHLLKTEIPLDNTISSPPACHSLPMVRTKLDIIVERKPRMKCLHHSPICVTDSIESRDLKSSTPAGKSKPFLTDTVNQGHICSHFLVATKKCGDNIPVNKQATVKVRSTSESKVEQGERPSPTSSTISNSPVTLPVACQPIEEADQSSSQQVQKGTKLDLESDSSSRQLRSADVVHRPSSASTESSPKPILVGQKSDQVYGSTAGRWLGRTRCTARREEPPDKRSRSQLADRSVARRAASGEESAAVTSASVKSDDRRRRAKKKALSVEERVSLCSKQDKKFIDAIMESWKNM